MRQRIKRACVASSSNYAQSKKAHRAYLKEQHEKKQYYPHGYCSKTSKTKD